MTPSKLRQPFEFVTPMAAQALKVLPEGREWLYEPKLNGYRALLIKHGQRIEIRSRNNKDLTPMYPAIAAGGQRLKADQVVLDGEIVALDREGRPSFQALQHRLGLVRNCHLHSRRKRGPGLDSRSNSPAAGSRRVAERVWEGSQHRGRRAP